MIYVNYSSAMESDMTNPRTAGPNTDGSKSLAKESKTGLAVSFVIYTLAQVLLGGLMNLDTSSWTGWWVQLAVAAISTVIGLLSAWLKSNR